MNWIHDENWGDLTGTCSVRHRPLGGQCIEKGDRGKRTRVSRRRSRYRIKNVSVSPSNFALIQIIIVAIYLTWVLPVRIMFCIGKMDDVGREHIRKPGITLSSFRSDFNRLIWVQDFVLLNLINPNAWMKVWLSTCGKIVKLLSNFSVSFEQLIFGVIVCNLSNRNSSRRSSKSFNSTSNHHT